MTGSEPNVIVTPHGAVTVVTMSYPQKRNPLALPLVEKLANALKAAVREQSCRVIVLTGDGGNFCSGGDISSFDEAQPIEGRRLMQQIHEVVRLIITAEKPVIAAVEGHAAGAGLCLAADCDIVVASSDAKFTCSFNRIGLLPDVGGLWSLPARMGLGRARMMMLTGRTLDAASAQDQGLVETLCEPGTALPTAITLAEEIAEFAPLTHAMVKSVLARGAMSADALLAMEADIQGLLFGTEDLKEGKAAFLQKRQPKFEGR